MAEEPEVILHQMEETRASLTEKLETLEDTVLGTVHGAKAAVTETVANVKESIQDTVDQVKESVQQTFDVRHHVRERPWTVMGGSVAVGFLIGRLLGGTPESRYVRRTARRVSHSVQDALERNGGRQGFQHDDYPAFATRQDNERRAHSDGPGMISELAAKFAPEIAQVKSLAIGTALSLLRDFVVKSVPTSVAPQLEDVANNLTTKLGGEPIPGPVTEYWTREKVASSFAQSPRSCSPDYVGTGEVHHD